MPIKKGKAKAKNLGAFAEKRKRTVCEGDDEDTQKRPRNMPPEQNSSDEENFGSDSEGFRNDFDNPIDPNLIRTVETRTPKLILRRRTMFLIPRTVQPCKIGCSSVIRTIPKTPAGAPKGGKKRLEREQQDNLRRQVKTTKIQDFFSAASRTRVITPEPIPVIEPVNSDDFTSMDVDLDPGLPFEEPCIRDRVVNEARNLVADLEPSPEPSKAPSPTADSSGRRR
ncbi:hypothetical protein B0H14DRAFT_3126239 [Mycena olivaceomarginata]|nr:hypothetical protein B0H14DRAFT_3126239 [Mycena olivaceomarginata]